MALAFVRTRLAVSRLANLLAALASAGGFLVSVPAHGQLSVPATALGVPSQPAVPGIYVNNAAAVAREISDRLNATSPGTVVVERPGSVLLGGSFE
jgi:hypothetical protein